MQNCFDMSRDHHSFNSFVRGHHVYKDEWTPTLGESLNCVREPLNEYFHMHGDWKESKSRLGFWFEDNMRTLWQGIEKEKPAASMRKQQGRDRGESCGSTKKARK